MINSEHNKEELENTALFNRKLHQLFHDRLTFVYFVKRGTFMIFMEWKEKGKSPDTSN